MIQHSVYLTGIEIKRRDDLPDTYEVYGADETGTALLEALIAPGASTRVFDIRILTGASAAGQIPTGYTDGGLANVRAYLVKTNLSTETNPRAAFAAAVATQPKLTGILNDPSDFLRLLWEASVTRNGGFALTYRRDDGSGLPQTIFASGDTATITVTIVHAADGALVHRGANAVLVGDGYDPAHVNLAAVSAKQSVTYTPDGTESLNDILARYRIPVSTLGEAAANAKLAAAAAIAVRGIVHEVRGPSKSDPSTEMLAQIAAAYGTTEDAIKNLNPGVSFTPLAALTLLRIPDLTRTGAQLPDFAGFDGAFGVGLGELAQLNAAVPKIFQGGGVSAFTFDDQLVDRVATLPPGNVGFVLQRDNPGSGTDAATTLAAQYNLLGFSLAENVTFKATVDALPVGPTKPRDGNAPTSRALLHATAADGIWDYTQALYAAGSVKNGDPSDPYAGVGTYAQAAFAPRDLFGNLAASAMTQPLLAPPQPQNKTPLRVAYTDALLGLGSWPSVGVDYLFLRDATSGKRIVSLAFTFDTTRYTPDAPVSPSTDPNQVPAWQQRALADEVAFRTLARQLAAPGVTMSLTTSMDGSAPHALDTAVFATFANDAAGYLAAVAAGGSPPLPLTPAVSIEIAPSNALDLFTLDVAVELARPTAQVDPAFRGTAAERSATAVAPRSAVMDGATTQALAAFAADLEAAYVDGDVFLKVATGRSQRDAAEATTVWILRLRTKPGTASDPGIGFAIDGAARYYAPRPLANVLISRTDVPIVRFDPQTGIDWNNPAETAFTGIALDVWGRTALAALDRFLSPDFAGAAFLIDHVDPNKAGYLQKILQIKSDLATDIAATVEPILQRPPLDERNPEPLNDAIETMRQQILAKAENAYVVSAICQYGATVSSRYTNDPSNNVYAPRFYGTIAAQPRVEAMEAGAEPVAPAQPWSFTVARPVLAPGDAFVSSALTVVDPTAQSHLPLDMTFRLSNIEYDIAKGVDGEYLASSWLSFVIPFDRQPDGAPRIDTTVGPVNVPVVLRAIPAAPSLVAQEAVPTPDDDSDPAKAFEQAKRWSYAFTYEKDVIAQDTIDCSVVFNLSDADPQLRLAARQLDLFDYLARLVSVWPAMLQTMIAVLVPDKLDLDPNSDAYKRARTLVADFAALLEPLPAAWALWHARLQRQSRLRALLGAPQSSTFAFSVQEQQNADGFLVARRTLGASTAQVWDPSAKQLVPLPPPRLEVEDDPTPWIGVPEPKDPSQFTFVRDGATLTYEQARKLRRRQPTFKGLNVGGLDVAAYQNAWSSVAVYRNRDLVRDAEGKTIPTTPDFVYATPEIRFASRVTPILLRSRAYPISALSSPPQQTLATHLARVMALLFEGTAPGTTQFVRFDAEYAQTIGAGLPPAIVPIFLGVPTTVTADGVAALVKNAATYILGWFSENTPPDGELRFTLTLFPTLSTSRLPLLQMTTLTLPRGDVTDLSS